jgi:hypothetical protein
MIEHVRRLIENPSYVGALAGSKTMEAVSTPSGSLADAMSQVEAGQVDDALTTLRALIQRTPSDGHAHALIGVCHAQQGNLEASVKALETAALLNPGDPAVEYNLACALFQVGRLDQAHWRVTRILETDPEHADAKALLPHVQRARAIAAAPAPGAVQRPEAASGFRTSGAPQPLGRSLPGGAPDLELTGSPGMGRRLLRGVGWGLLYSLWWTVFSLIGAFLLSLFATKVEHAVIAFALMGVMATLFHSAMGALAGVVTALLNADEDGGAWVGGSVGFLILLIGLFAGLLAMWAIVFYIGTGISIGRAIAFRVQKPVAA